MSSTFQASMSLYIKGSKRLNAMAKQMLGLDLSEGKKPMSRKVYKRICEILFSSSEPKHLFGHLFFVLDWQVIVKDMKKINKKQDKFHQKNEKYFIDFS